MDSVILINYLGKKGGGCLDAYETAVGFIQNKKKVIAVVSKDAENIEAWRKLNLEKLIEVKTYHTKVQFIWTSIYFILVKRYKIARELKGIKIDYLYCPMITMWTGFLNEVFKENRIVVVNHDPKPHSGEENRIIGYLNKKTYENANVILVHSKQFVDYVKELYGKPCEYVPLGRHNVYKSIEIKKKLLSYDSSKWNILFFGRISKYKGLDVLADAFAMLERERDDVFLTVVGNGDFSPYREKYSKLDNVRIINQWIKDEEVESVFEGEKLINVLPYTDATQSGVALLAMDYSVPVIATKTGGLTEQIENGITGILVEPKNSHELYLAIKSLIENQELYTSVVQNEKRYIEGLSWKETTRQIIDILEKNV